MQLQIAFNASDQVSKAAWFMWVIILMWFVLVVQNIDFTSFLASNEHSPTADQWDGGAATRATETPPGLHRGRLHQHRTQHPSKISCISRNDQIYIWHYSTNSNIWDLCTFNLHHFHCKVSLASQFILNDSELIPAILQVTSLAFKVSRNHDISYNFVIWHVSLLFVVHGFGDLEFAQRTSNGSTSH